MSSSTNIISQPVFGTYFIKSKLKGDLYLDVQSRTVKQGAYVTIDTFHGGLSQQWIIAGPKIQSAANPSLILDVKGQTGPYIILWPSNNGANQHWLFQGDQVHTMLDGRVLDVKVFEFIW
jgi:hypothetical protein